MQVTTMGIDLTKQVFQVHGIDAHGAVVLKKRFTRSTLYACMATFRRAELDLSVPSVQP